MATGRSIGTVYAEIDLDSSRYLRSQKQLLKDATSTSLSIEQNFKNLGVRSSAEFDLMRAKITNSYNMIASSAKATANDIIRAEQAKNAQLKALNEQQFGHHVGLLQNLKSNYFQISTSIAASIYAIQQVAAPFVRVFEKGFMAVETYGQSVASLAAMVVTFTERQKGVSLGDQWKEALAYSTEMVPILENIAAKTLLSGQETTALANAFARAGVFLDASNAKQMESFTRVSNALPILTQGQEIMRQINSEIRAVMTGANEATSMMLQTLKAVDPEIEKHLKTWRAEGTVMEHLGDLLSGFGPATALLENQWQAVKSTIDTTVTQVLRGGMKPAYDEIITRTKDINAFLDEHRGMIQGGIRIGWMTIQDITGTAKGFVSGMLPMLSDMGKGIGVVAYGWSGVLAVLKPVGAFLGNSVAITWELAKMIGNSVVAIGALATMQTDVAKVAWDEAKKGFANVEKYSAANRDLLVNGLADAVAGYGNRTAAALASDKAVSNSAAASRQYQAKSIDAVTEAQKAAAKKRETAEKQLEAEIEKTINERQKLTGNLYAYKAQEIERDLNKYREAGVSEVNIARLKTEKLKNLYEEVSKAWRESMAKWDEDTLKKMEGPTADLGVTQEMLTAYSTLYSGIVARSQHAYDVQEALIYEQGNKFYEVTKDEVAVAQWEAEQLEKLYIERAKYSTDWRDGMKAGFLEIQRDATTWGGAMQSLTKSTFTNMSSTFSTVFYDVITGKFEDIGDAFEKLGEGMLKNFTEILGKIAAEKIVMYFETQWAKEGAGVLGVLSKLMGISLNAGSGGSTVTTTVDYTDMVQVEATGGMWTGGRVPFGDGGAVGGWPRYPGNHPGNDTVPAWLSPGEVVIRRTSVNPDTAQILDYINKTGQNPGFYNGGSVAGMVTDQPGRGYWGWDDFASIFSGGLYDLFQGDMPFTQAYSSTAGNFLSQILFPGSFSQTLAAINKYMTTEGGTWESLAAAIDRWIDPGGVVDWSTRTSGEQMPESLRAIAPQVGAIIGSLIYPGYGTAAGYGIGAKIQGQAYRQSFQGAGISLAASQVSSSVNDYITGVTGDKLAGKAAGLIAGNLMRMGLGAVAAATVTDAIISSNMKAEFTGLGSTKGIANSLSDLAGMVGKDYTVSAKNGLDYVPYDGMIVKTHRGEAVITAEENEERRSGGGGSTFHFNFTVEGDSLDHDGLARKLIPALEKAVKKYKVHA